MKANQLISSQLSLSSLSSSSSTTKHSMLYADKNGKVMSSDGTLMYDSTKQSLSLETSKILDVSNGIFRLSKSQKASILYGIDSDINLRDNGMKANQLISSQLSLSSLSSSSSTTKHSMLYA